MLMTSCRIGWTLPVLMVALGGQFAGLPVHQAGSGARLLPGVVVLHQAGDGLVW